MLEGIAPYCMYRYVRLQALYVRSYVLCMYGGALCMYAAYPACVRHVRWRTQVCARQAYVVCNNGYVVYRYIMAHGYALCISRQCTVWVLCMYYVVYRQCIPVCTGMAAQRTLYKTRYVLCICICALCCVRCMYARRTPMYRYG